jgi:hypothetical protein
MMRNTWQWFALIAVPARTLAAQPVAVTNDATRTAQPVAKLLFGGFMEPAPPPSGGFGPRGPQRRWMPVGAGIGQSGIKRHTQLRYRPAA